MYFKVSKYLLKKISSIEMSYQVIHAEKSRAFKNHHVATPSQNNGSSVTAEIIR